MKRIFLYTGYVCFLYFGLGIYKAMAQDPAVNVPGKIKYGSPGHPWIKVFEWYTLDYPQGRKFYGPLFENAARICSIVTDVPVLHPPKGFNIDPDPGGSGIQPADRVHLPGLDVTFCIYPLYFDKKTHQAKPSSIWGSSMRLYINETEMLVNHYNYLREACDSSGVRVFYYKPEMHKDKNGFRVIHGIKTTQDIRVIKKKGVPLFVPVTQKEYLEFQVKLEQNNLINNKREVADYKRTLRKVTDPKEQKSLEGLVKSWEDNVSNTIRAMRDYQKALSTMSAEQLNAPAHNSVYFSGPKYHDFSDLAPANYKGSTEIVRINSNYFDTTLPKSAVQLILVATDYFEGRTAPELVFKIKKWFHQIDYEKLQNMIQ